MSKILITGGAGFVGYLLARRLSEDSSNNVTIIDDFSRGEMDSDFQNLIKRRNVQFIQADLTNSDILLQLDRNYEYIYHLAAIIGVRNVMQNPDKVLYVNAISTLNVFEYIKTCKCIKKAFFSSSSEVYAGTSKHFAIDVPTNEDVQLTVEDISADRTTYALSKMYGESAGFVYSRKYSIPLTIGRFHNVYGPRMGFDHVIPETFVKVSKNDIIDVPSPTHTRTFCFVDDAVEFAVRACKNTNTTNEILHIGNSKEEISIKDLVITIAQIMDKEIAIRELADTPGSVARRCPDISKVEHLTGYSPQILLEEGIRRTYEWYKDKLQYA